MKHAIGCTIETLAAVIRSHSLTLVDAAVAITPFWLDAVCIAAAPPSA